MNIAFISPPFFPKYSRGSRSPAVAKSGTIYYPIWLALAAGVAEKHGHTIILIDSPAEPITSEETFERLSSFNPGLVIIDTSTGSISSDIRFAEETKRRFYSAFVCMVGNHVTAVDKETMQQSEFIDAVARNEYEATIVDLAERLEKNESLENVLSLTWRKGDEIIANGHRPALTPEELDRMPFASEIFKRFVNSRNYFFAAGRYPQMMVYTGRGCPYLCTWCMYPQNFYGHTYRHRTPQSIAAEFKFIEENFPEVVEVTIEDDTFTVYKKHTIEICKALIAQKNKLTWTCNARADLDEETMRWMKKAKCRLLTVGFESGSNEILKLMKKGMRVERFTAAENARKTGILIHGTYMMGNRGETLQTMHETLELAKKLNTDTAQFYPLMLYPGTEAYDWAKKEGLISAKSWDDWLTQDGLHNNVVGTHDLTPQEIVDFCNYARREYYWRPAYLLMKIRTTVIHPTEWRRTIKAFFNFAKYLFNKDNKKFQKIFHEKIENLKKTSHRNNNRNTLPLQKDSASLNKAEIKA